MSEKLRHFHDRVSEHLDEIKELLVNDAKITIVIRMPHLPDGGIVIGDDDYDLAIAEIQRLRERPPTFEPQGGAS